MQDLTRPCPRISVTSEGEHVRIDIAPRRSLLAAAVGIWGGAILALPILAWVNAGFRPPSDWPILLTLIFCAVWAFAIFNWAWLQLWNLFGREEIHLLPGPGLLNRKRRLLLFRRGQVFRLDGISALNFHDERRGKGIRLKYIAFDYSGRRERLTQQLSDEEGAALLAGPLRGLRSTS